MNDTDFFDTEKNKVVGGTLYLVTTPIGNMSDITYRAVKVLSEVDFVAAEDTRNSARLLRFFDISKELVSYHEHNKKSAGEKILARLQSGESCALVTDAGTPAVSDPGEDLVRLCADAGIPVTAAPGVSAAVTALTLSALNTRRFVFEDSRKQDKLADGQRHGYRDGAQSLAFMLQPVFLRRIEGGIECEMLNHPLATDTKYEHAVLRLCQQFLGTQGF